MAFWGAPAPGPQHALSACVAAVRAQQLLRELRPNWAAAGKPPCLTRMGIHTGEVVVGNIGSASRGSDGRKKAQNAQKMSVQCGSPMPGKPDQLIPDQDRMECWFRSCAFCAFLRPFNVGRSGRVGEAVLNFVTLNYLPHLR
jgi:hypothetical protein